MKNPGKSGVFSKIKKTITAKQKQSKEMSMKSKIHEFPKKIKLIMSKKLLILTAIFLLGNSGFAQAEDMGKIMYERADFLYKTQKFDSALYLINKAVKASPKSEEYILNVP